MLTNIRGIFAVKIHQNALATRALPKIGWGGGQDTLTTFHLFDVEGILSLTLGAF